MPADSIGNPWTASYINASGNLLADFRLNLTYESQGRLQAVRLYEMTTDPGVKDMLSFLIARDTMHQNQWYAAICELEEKKNIVVPSTFPRSLEKGEVAYDYYDLSGGTASQKGRWASGKSMDGLGEFKYFHQPQPFGKIPNLRPAPPYTHNTLPMLPPNTM